MGRVGKRRFFFFIALALAAPFIFGLAASSAGETGVEAGAEPVFAAPDARGFVPGASGLEGDRALLLAGQRFIEINAGPDHPSGNGCLYLPNREGTIEFFLRPTWGSEEAEEGRRRFLMGRLREPGGSSYLQLDHYLEDNTVRFWTRVKNEETGAERTVRGRARHVFEKGRWTHVALAWGERMDLFIDGRRVARSPVMGGPLASPLRLLQVGYFVRNRPDTNTNAEIDNLRISGTVRYKDDFEPPSPGEKFEMDGHTRLLVTFDEGDEVSSYGHEGPVTAVRVNR